MPCSHRAPDSPPAGPIAACAARRGSSSGPALVAREPTPADRGTTALREVFGAERNRMVERLEATGLRFAAEPKSTFCCRASIADPLAPVNDADVFSRRALERKVMTVPGVFFDVDPYGERTDDSPFEPWMRFSFGPPMDDMEVGLDRLARMLAGG